MENKLEEKKKYSTLKFDKVKVVLPTFNEVIGQGWISYGADNMWPNFMIDLYNRSAMNRTCIVAKQEAAVGNGLRTQDPSQEWVLKQANSRGETWSEIFEKATLDYVIHGGFALNIIWGKTGEFIADIYHLDFSKVRSGLVNSNTDRVEEYYYCSDWLRSRKYKPVAYKTFDKAASLTNPSQILYCFNYSPGNQVYPLADYVGGTNDIQTDIQTSLFHISNLNNGLNPSMWINMKNGVPDPKMQQDIYNAITSAFTGTENGGKFFLSFSDSAETAPEVIPVTSTNDTYYIALDTRVTTRILTAHRITSPLLLGIRDSTGGGLGSNKDEIIVAYEHFLSTVIRPITTFLLKQFQMLMDGKGYTNVELYVEPYKIFDANTDVTVDEGDVNNKNIE